VRAFAQAERFVSELESHKLRPAYVFVGDEAFFRKRFRDAIIEHLVPADLRDFSLFEFDFAENDLAEVLDRARTPSLMSPFQVFFVRGVKNLFGRGSNDEKLAAIEDYCKNPNPDALLVFVADHISIPADVRRMEMQDKERYQRIRETMGRYCGIVELARVEEGEAVRWISEFCTGSRRENRRRRRPRIGRRTRWRHDDDLQRTGEADALRRRPQPHQPGRR
jgi:DNA polymerase III subunit delta